MQAWSLVELPGIITYSPAAQSCHGSQLAALVAVL